MFEAGNCCLAKSHGVASVELGTHVQDDTLFSINSIIRSESGQVRRCLDSKLHELGGRGSTDAPDLFDRHGGQQLRPHLVGTQIADVAILRMFLAMKLATFARVFVGAMPT